MKPIDHNGPGIHYAIFYRRVQDPAPMIRVEVQHWPEKKRPAYTVTDTEFYEQFEFQIQAINALGPGPKSAIVYGYSGERCKLHHPYYLLMLPLKLNIQVYIVFKTVQYIFIVDNIVYNENKQINFRVKKKAQTTDYF